MEVTLIVKKPQRVVGTTWRCRVRVTLEVTLIVKTTKGSRYYLEVQG